jgi:hypothetical protein
MAARSLCSVVSAPSLDAKDIKLYWNDANSTVGGDITKPVS